MNQSCDYYFCKLCKGWHRTTTKTGKKHIKYFDSVESNKDNADYYFDNYHKIWHRDNRNYIKNRAKLSIENGKIIKK